MTIAHDPRHTIHDARHMKAKIYITLKSGVLDPQGKATLNALHHLGFSNAKDVRMGKYIEVELSEPDKKKAETELKDMCEKLLANTVVESYRVELITS